MQARTGSTQEIKALVEGGAIRPELNYNALADYAANRYTSGEETLFRGVKRLLPGHTLIWRDGEVEIDRYWDLSFKKPEERAPEAQYVERFGELVVRHHPGRDATASPSQSRPR